ncbi:MAG: FAD-dependent oxidoreductase [Dehalococcoidia bacterium]|nr:FAD-dependent oxidoreductase [Dehalococcoidia bacterium]
MSNNSYDVLVIGSGIGGIGTALLLQDKGYRTLTIEKDSRIGGRYSTYEYEGFKLPTGAVAIHYRGTAMEEFFKVAGEQCEFIDVPRLFYRIAGKDYEMPAKGSLSTGMEIINRLEEDKAKVFGGFAKVIAKEKVMGAFRLGVKEAKEGGPTFKDWLLQYTDNELAHGIFDTITNTLCGAHSYEIPASSVFAFFRTMGGNRDVAIAPRGNLANLEKLAGAIKRKGGEIWLNARAKKINVSGNSVRSVIIERDGREEEITARVVVSDIGPRATIDLAGEGFFGEDYCRQVRVKLRPHPVTMIYLASDRPLWPEKGDAAILMVVGARRVTSVIPLSNVSPHYAPPGQHLTFVFGGPVSNEVRMDPKSELDMCLLDLKEHFPSFEKHGRVLKVVSKNIDDELPEGRSRLGSMMPVETPIKNLLCVGDACCSFGFYGSTGAAETARTAAEIVKKLIRR